MSKLLAFNCLAAVARLVSLAILLGLGAYAEPAQARESIDRPATPLLGDRAPQLHRNHLHAGRAEAVRLRTRTSSITGVVYIFIDPGNTASSVAVGIYGNDGSHPGLLLSKGSRSALRANAWSAISVATVRLMAGRIYWLAVLGEGGTLRYRSRQHGSCLSTRSVQTGLLALPDRWGLGRVSARAHCPISAYMAAAAPTSSLSPLEPDTTVPPFEQAAQVGLVSPLEPSSSPAGKRAPTLESSPSEEEPPRIEEQDEKKEEEPPPPPPAPTDTVLPVISGSAVEGETLYASTGAWTGSPTSYAYQWEDCYALGEDCMSVSGATASSYELTAADVGYTVRVVVTATNAGGSNAATSRATAEVVEAPAPPPTAPKNTALPTVSGSAEEGQTLTASRGEWTESPTSFAFQWQDCGTGSKKGCANIAGATGLSYELTASDVGYGVRIVVKASNEAGSGKASSAVTTMVVPIAPTSSAPPVIEGSAVEGETLDASTGTWTGSPSSYAYQWEDCDPSGANCSVIGDATTSARVLAASDVGHTVRIVVKATNAGGAGEAVSAATSIVTAKEEVKEGTPTDCFENPETEGTERIEKCGYPGPKNTAVENCADLAKSEGGRTITTEGEKIENTDINGSITVEAKNVTLNHDCVISNGGEALGTQAIKLEADADNFTLANSTVRAENDTTDSFEEAVQNNGPSASNAVLAKDRLEDCTECIHNEFTVDESYVIADGMQKREAEHKGEIHREDWFYWGATVSAKDDTMLDPYTQVSVLFGEGGSPCENHLTIEDSFVAGGDWIFTPCSKSTGAGSSTMTVKDNRFARCLGSEEGIGEGPEGYECKGGSKEHDAEGFDAHGYFPKGGWDGLAWEYYTGPGQVWEGNFWDDNLENANP